MTGVSQTATIVAAFDSAPITRHLALLAITDARGWDGARREIGEYMLGEVQDAFDTQKLFDGSAMPQSKAAIKRKGKTLIDKHHLYDSYVYQLVPGGVAWGSNSVYAAIHHFGGETGRRGARFTMPARPVMGVAPRHERRLGDILIADIQRTQRT